MDGYIGVICIIIYYVLYYNNFHHFSSIVISSTLTALPYIEHFIFFSINYTYTSIEKLSLSPQDFKGFNLTI